MTSGGNYRKLLIYSDVLGFFAIKFIFEFLRRFWGTF